MIFSSVPITVPLLRPIRDGDRAIRELTLRAPSIGAHRAPQAMQPNDDLGRAMALIHVLFGVRVDVLADLVPDDLVALANAAAKMITLPAAPPKRGLKSLWRR